MGGDGPPAYQPMRRIADYGAGILGAYGVVLALLHRGRTGEGQHVATSLAQACTFHQTGFMPIRPGGQPDEPGGHVARGRHPLRRLYRASDSWLFVAGSEPPHASFASVPELADLAELAGQALEQALEARLVTDRVATWLGRLRAVGLEATACNTVREMLDDVFAERSGISVSASYGGVPRRTTGPSLRFSRTPTAPVRLPAPYGADTAAILRELGLAEQADDLERRGIVATAPLL